MSKYIDEIIKDIRENPEQWVRHTEFGIKKGEVELSQFGNGNILSVVRIEINGKDSFHQATFVDKYRLEKAFSWWMKNASLDMLLV